MEPCFIDDLEIIPEIRGRDDWKKFSFPVTYGIFTRIKWKGYEFDFNVRGHLKRISGKGAVWPNPLERLKRTDGNDFLYYGMDGYENTYDLIKNYYVLHNEIYGSPLFLETPFEDSHVKKALSAFDLFIKKSREALLSGINGETRAMLEKVAALDRRALAGEGEKLHAIIGGPFPILPPDTTNVDYEVIPLRVMDGCPHRCGFCQFKTDKNCRIRSRENILDQLQSLKILYGEDLVNYNSLVLGENNALAAGIDLLEFAAEKSFDILSFAKSFHSGEPNLFLFGSVELFLKTDETAFQRLNALPYNTYLNIGFESSDDETLTFIGKSLSGSIVREAFQKALHINRTYPRINISGNFILGNSLPPQHVEELKTLLSRVNPWQGKGTVYLSPLVGASERRQVLREFREIKRTSLLPVFLYLMQRL
jgi:hypothetical protein